ncbi:MAG: fibronectin type III domain-containing protein [Gammaproteobacteria bacterium]
MNAPRFFRRLFGVAGLLMLAVTWVAPAHAVTKPGPPRIQLSPTNGIWDAIAIVFSPPVKKGEPRSTHVHIRWRQIGVKDVIWDTPAAWSNHGGEAGLSNLVGVPLPGNLASAFNWNDEGERGFIFTHGGVNGAGSGHAPVAIGSTWEVQMAYYNGVIGEWSAPQFITTGAPVAPLNPAVASGPSGFKIDWETGDQKHESFNGYELNARGELLTTGHRVRWREAGKSAYSYANNLAGDARSHFQTGLVAGVTYYVSVAGTNKNGTGLWGPYGAELPVIAGRLRVEPWVGKAGGIDARWANHPGATKKEVRFRKYAQFPEAQWTGIEVADPIGNYQLSHEDNDIEPGGRYEVQVREFADAAWQDWSQSAILRSSTHDDLAPRLRWMAVSEANGDLRMTEPAVSSEVFAYSVYIPSAITLANFAVQPQTRAAHIC